MSPLPRPPPLPTPSHLLACVNLVSRGPAVPYLCLSLIFSQGRGEH